MARVSKEGVSRAAQVRGERVEIAGEIPGHCGLTRVSDGGAAGELQTSADGEALVIERLCVEEGLRGYGLGSEAAALVRRAAEEGPWKVLRAWAPPDRGLAVYFWCRMGLSPLHGEGPDGGLWFERGVG
jgi:hypothetical protein